MEVHGKIALRALVLAAGAAALMACASPGYYDSYGYGYGYGSPSYSGSFSVYGSSGYRDRYYGNYRYRDRDRWRRGYRYR